MEVYNPNLVFILLTSLLNLFSYCLGVYKLLSLSPLHYSFLI